MTVSDIYAAARAELNRRAASDKQLSALLEKIRSGKATFEDTAAYNERLSNLLGETLAKYVELPDGSGANADACIQLLTEQHGNINALLAEVQRAMDSRIGLNLNPIQPKFPAERVQQIAQALEDMTVPFETIQRRANAPVANVSKSFHDSYMKENAKFRSNAGLKCYLNRQSHGQCCAWCSAIVGRYEYGDHPDDIFRRHDNCSCTVTFENGRQRQDVWSKHTWEVPDKDAGADAPTVFDEGTRPVGFQPTKFTPKQAKYLQEYLTNGGGTGTINYAKPIAMMNFSDVSSSAYTPASIASELERSSIGREILQVMESLPEPIRFINIDDKSGVRGEERDGRITINLNNCKNVQWVARTIIHECTHYRYGIGNSQWAECVCIAQELKHARGTDKLSRSDLRLIVEAVQQAYPELQWRKGGYINGRRKK